MESDRLDGHYLREIKGGAESQKFYAIPVPGAVKLNRCSAALSGVNNRPDRDRDGSIRIMISLPASPPLLYSQYVLHDRSNGFVSACPYSDTC